VAYLGNPLLTGWIGLQDVQGRVLALPSVAHLKNVATSEQQDLLRQCIKLNGGMQWHLLNTSKHAEYFAPYDAFEVLCAASHRQAPVIAFAVKHASDVMPSVVDLQSECDTFQDIKQLRTEIKRLTPDTAKAAGTKLFKQVVSTDGSPRLLLGIRRATNPNRTNPLLQEVTVKGLLTPATSFQRALREQMLMREDSPMDERQLTRKRIKLALHAAAQLAACAQLETPIVTRSTATDQVTLTVSGGVVTHVEYRALHNFRLHAQPLPNDGRGERPLSYTQMDEQNAGFWFGNDNCDAEHDDKLLESVSNLHAAPTAELLQPVVWHHTVDADTFGIAMLMLQLLAGQPITLDCQSDLVAHWTQYSQVSRTRN
jgi:hypothetical protein